MKQAMKMALPCGLLLLGAASWTRADEWDKKTDVTVSQPIEIPGTVLQPGKYVFKLANSPSDRHIAQISSEDGKHVYATIFTVAARRLEPSDKILTFYEMPAGQPEAVRYWFWPGELDGQEFTYPHNRASEISKATGIDVKETPADFSAKDETVVSKNEAPAPEAAAPVTEQPAVAEAPLVAQNNPPETPRAPAVTPPPAPSEENTPENTPLPQTATNVPLAALIGCLALAGALATRLAIKRS